MPTEFKLPELGENIDSGDIVDILVSEGDVVEEDQNLLEIETDKAVIEVPSTVHGKIQQIHVKEGTTVKVGAVLFTIEETTEAEDGEGKKEETGTEEVAVSAKEEALSEGEAISKESAEPPAAGAGEEKSAEPWTSPAEPPQLDEEVIYERPRPGKLVPAAPSVRRLAREIGVDIQAVPGSGPEGRITQEDVKKYSKQLHTRRQAAAGAPISTEPLPDFSKWGSVEIESMSNVRRKTAE
ncbi:MAG: E3 binding domain-containing protein, partial [Calditrichota bacterium]